MMMMMMTTPMGIEFVEGTTAASTPTGQKYKHHVTVAAQQLVGGVGVGRYCQCLHSLK